MSHKYKIGDIIKYEGEAFNTFYLLVEDIKTHISDVCGRDHTFYLYVTRDLQDGFLSVTNTSLIDGISNYTLVA